MTGDFLDLTIDRVAHGGHCVARIGAGDASGNGVARIGADGANENGVASVGTGDDGGGVDGGASADDAGSDDVGRVVFVRHALPGERVRARVTSRGKIWRADAVDLLGDPSPDRVPSPWPEAGPDLGDGRSGVGGGELAHVSLDGQRRWKAAVVADQFSRLAKIDLAEAFPDFAVEAAPGDGPIDQGGRGGLHYRTRIDLVTDGDGRAGMLGHRSHDVVPLDTMPLATEAVLALADAENVWRRRWPRDARLTLVAPANGTDPLLLVGGVPSRKGKPDIRPNARATVTETVQAATGETYTYRVAADGFWQVHRQAPALLVDAVTEAVGDVAGQVVFDLYAGAGLFTLPLADAVGPRGRVVTVEGDETAVKQAKRNTHARANVELHRGAVARVMAGRYALAGDSDRPAAFVLDPPRAGAGATVIDQVARLQPDRVIYVACDPAALARDTSYLLAHGFRLGSLRAFDLFPMTHHVECVATMTR
ncbi:MAG: class I SAM-dependent RNA methyltransferase [Cellulomonadaceae bacterium]|jgi:tRNA/tmRNA/rRNA uracil-C5-methylase (TrmA/RlmC/RlmD family)|nr:class I SAM-dependent RNA methyltransferase [Cellulomonadaceae bacterium]